jgi:hypothetical protein
MNCEIIPCVVINYGINELEVPDALFIPHHEVLQGQIKGPITYVPILVNVASLYFKSPKFRSCQTKEGFRDLGIPVVVEL